MALRQASVAGAFYPGSKEELLRQLKQLFEGIPAQEKTSCVVAPHAGYAYSGRTAAHAFSALKGNGTIVLLGPSHTGLGELISVSNVEEWETPLGKVPIDKTLREKLIEKLEIEADNIAHVQEHSLEVELPFLQFLFKGFKVLPVTIMEHRLEELENLGKTLAELPGEFSVVASGDFTHQEPLEQAKEKDLAAIAKIEAMEVEGFYKEVVSKNLSICGLAPITALMYYCRERGFGKGKLLKYDSSASSTGDSSSVVGYAAIGFY